MHPISDKELDKLFQQRFGVLEIEPSAAVWNKITTSLDEKRGRGAIFPSLWMAAAGIVVVFSAGLLYFSPQEVIKLHGHSEITQNLEKTSTPAKQKELIAGIAEPQNSDQMIPVNSTDFSFESTSGIISSEYPLIQSSSVAEPEIKLPAEAEPLLISSAVVKKVNPVQPKKVVKVPSRYSGDQSELDVTQPDMMAKAEFTEDEEYIEENELRGQKKIRSIGSLVNFVIAKVDKREDKLIEFKDSDEGSEVSGINLGLVKIKSKK
ncbi:MAG: hypothetical protein ACOYKR_01030 [Sphingobacterium thalpophilum]|jgi:hypothetical protein